MPKNYKSRRTVREKAANGTRDSNVFRRVSARGEGHRVQRHIERLRPPAFDPEHFGSCGSSLARNPYVALARSVVAILSPCVGRRWPLFQGRYYFRMTLGLRGQASTCIALGLVHLGETFRYQPAGTPGIPEPSFRSRARGKSPSTGPSLVLAASTVAEGAEQDRLSQRIIFYYL